MLRWRPKPRGSTRSISRTASPYVLLTPVLLLIFIFEIYPVALTIWYSMTDKVPGAPANFIGLDNFASLLKTPDFLKVVGNTFIYILTNVGIKIPLAFLAALFLLSFTGRLRGIFRVLILLPWVTPDIPNLMMWRYILDPDSGVVTKAFEALNLPHFIFLANPTYTIYVIAIIHAWKYVPLFAVIFLAGLMSIPPELDESAVVDGANYFQRLRHVIIPLMKKLFIICFLLSTVWMAGEFVTVWILTQGGPAYGTHLLATLAYIQAFNLGKFGVGSAILVIMLPITVPLILATIVLMGRR